MSPFCHAATWFAIVAAQNASSLLRKAVDSPTKPFAFYWVKQRSAGTETAIFGKIDSLTRNWTLIKPALTSGWAPLVLTGKRLTHICTLARRDFDTKSAELPAGRVST